MPQDMFLDGVTIILLYDKLVAKRQANNCNCYSIYTFFYSSYFIYISFEVKVPK